MITAPETDRIAVLIATYGADPARWPPQDRPLHNTAQTSHADGLADEAHLDRFLSAADPAVPLPERLAASILVHAPRPVATPWAGVAAWFGEWRGLAVGTALALVVGTSVGIAQAEVIAANQVADQFITTSLDSAFGASGETDI